jgi:hypothetical protein
MSLMSPQALREYRDQLTERELWERCQSAARLELRGSRYSSDDRQDCAAQIMADGLAALNGSLPIGTDPKHSLGAYCKRAQTIRRSLERQRARDDLAAQEEQDAHAWSVDALLPEESAPVEVTAEEASHAAIAACQRLGLDPSRGPVMALFYGYARDLPGAQIAHELGMSPNGYDVACHRARALVRAAYPDAEAFLTALCGDPVWTVDPMTGEPTLRFALHDDSREAHDRTHALAQDWRDGTDAGSWPTRPETIEDARARCEVRYRRGAPQTADKRRQRAYKHTSAEQVEADALKRLGWALAAA